LLTYILAFYISSFIYFFRFTCVFFYFFFFSSRRRHTRCLSDWSSDVCSSDLLFHFLDDALGSHLLERFFQRLIAALYQVNVDFVRVLHAPPPADQRSFVRMTLVERAGNDRFRRRGRKPRRLSFPCARSPGAS